MYEESPAVQHLLIHLSNEHYVNFYAHQTVVRGQSRVLLSKSNEPISTKSSILVCIMFPSFLASSVCVMQCDSLYLN